MVCRYVREFNAIKKKQIFTNYLRDALLTFYIKLHLYSQDFYLTFSHSGVKICNCSLKKKKSNKKDMLVNLVIFGFGG